MLLELSSNPIFASELQTAVRRRRPPGLWRENCLFQALSPRTRLET